MTADLTARARAGDSAAFRELVEPYQRELELHCYRMLGSVHDAQDALQETLIAAWRGLGGFEGRSSVRTWLYQVATNCCLKTLRAARRRPQASWPPPGRQPPEASRLGEVTWLEPYPDTMLAGVADASPGPEARYEAAESVSLAFITALQLLPARQRAALVLREVLGYPARETAAILGSSEESVTSALKRARATLRSQLPDREGQPTRLDSASEQALITRFTKAFQDGDLQAVVALLADDVRLAMPPAPHEYLGRDLAARFFAATAFQPGRAFRFVPTRANGQPALGAYTLASGDSVAHANSLLVLALAGDQICDITRFDASLLASFGLPAAVSG